ncbi:MAG: choice-of-anchor A family protein, partial [Ruminococcus sp.]|nr:choice-of-anchor A family protein [Ruminococcus sp.]
MKKSLVKRIVSGVTSALLAVSAFAQSVPLGNSGLLRARAASSLDGSKEIDDVTLLVGENPKGPDGEPYGTFADVNAAIEQYNKDYLLGIAGRFCVFLDGDFEPTESDTEGRVAVSGSIKPACDWNYEIGNGDFCWRERPDGTYKKTGLDVLLDNNNYANVIVNGEKMTKVHMSSGDDYLKPDGTAGKANKLFWVGSGTKVDNGANKSLIYKSDGFSVSDQFGRLAVTSKKLAENKCYQDISYNGSDTITLTYTGEAADVVYFHLNETEWENFRNASHVEFLGIPKLKEPRKVKVSDGTDGTWDLAYIIINVDGENVHLANIQNENGQKRTSINGTWISRSESGEKGENAQRKNNHYGVTSLLYNFYQAKELVIGNNFQGTLFAPKASVTDEYTLEGTNNENHRGHLSGALVAKSFKGGTEFGYRPFSGPIDILDLSPDYAVEIVKNVQGFGGTMMEIDGATFAVEQCDESGKPTGEVVQYVTADVTNAGFGQQVEYLAKGLKPGKYKIYETDFSNPWYQGYKVNKDTYYNVEITESGETSVHDATYSETEQVPDVYTIGVDGFTQDMADSKVEINGFGGIPQQYPAYTPAEEAPIEHTVTFDVDIENFANVQYSKSSGIPSNIVIKKLILESDAGVVKEFDLDVNVPENADGKVIEPEIVKTAFGGNEPNIKKVTIKFSGDLASEEKPLNMFCQDWSWNKKANFKIYSGMDGLTSETLPITKYYKIYYPQVSGDKIAIALPGQQAGAWQMSIEGTEVTHSITVPVKCPETVTINVFNSKEFGGTPDETVTYKVADQISGGNTITLTKELKNQLVIVNTNSDTPEPPTPVEPTPPAEVKEVKISKVDNESKSVAGATLKLTGVDKDGKAIVFDANVGNDVTVAENGTSITWESTNEPKVLDLPYGKYTLTEQKAPDGYVKSEKTLEFEVSSDPSSLQGTSVVNAEKYPKAYTIENVLTDYCAFVENDFTNVTHVRGPVAVGGNGAFETIGNTVKANTYVENLIKAGYAWDENGKVYYAYYGTKDSSLDGLDTDPSSEKFSGWKQNPGYIDFGKAFAALSAESEALTNGAETYKPKYIESEEASVQSNQLILNLADYPDKNIVIPYETLAEAAKDKTVNIIIVDESGNPVNLLTGGYTISVTGVNDKNIGFFFDGIRGNVDNLDIIILFTFNSKEETDDKTFFNRFSESDGVSEYYLNGTTTIWNFPDAKGIIYAGNPVGHFVSPNADVVQHSGNTNGGMICKSLDSGEELHYFSYNKVTLNNNEAIVNFVNEKTNITVDKLNITGDTELPDAKITITRKDGTELDENVVKSDNETFEINGNSISFISKADGKTTIEGLPVGKYTLTEEQAPQGYDRFTSEWEFEIKENGSIDAKHPTEEEKAESHVDYTGNDIVVKDAKIKVEKPTLKISKWDVTNKAELPGAILKIETTEDLTGVTVDGKAVEIKTENEKNYFTFESKESVSEIANLPAGEYKLIEDT